MGDKLFEVVIKDDKGNVLYYTKGSGKMQIPIGKLLEMRGRFKDQNDQSIQVD